jgi:RND family efflux transporter MFP subunit
VTVVIRFSTSLALLIALSSSAQAQAPTQAMRGSAPVDAHAIPLLLRNDPLLSGRTQTQAVRSAAPVDPNAIRVLLSPELETTLASQMMGRISALNASLGVAVAKGRPLVVFDCSEANAKLQMAQAEYAMAKETLETKIGLRKLEAAGDMEVTLARAGADRAQAAIAVSKVQIEQCTVVAPFSGRIVKLHVKPYQGVTLGSPLLEMVSDGALKLRLNVPSRLLRTLRIGSGFEVDIEETGKTYAAKVTAINARVDAVAQTLELEGRIDGKPAGLLAGMTGIARINAAP